MNALTTIDRQYQRLLRWLYEDQNPVRARPVADRLEDLLARASDDEVGAIFAEECRSLISEARGDLQDAIKHRQNEIRRILHLHEISRSTESENFVFTQYDYEDLRDRLYILASLYHENGDLERAIETLKTSRQLCLQRGLEFDWADVLREYEEEHNANISYAVSISENGVPNIVKAELDVPGSVPTAIAPSLNGKVALCWGLGGNDPIKNARKADQAQTSEPATAEVSRRNTIRRGILV
jgi:hypothetical protein